MKNKKNKIGNVPNLRFPGFDGEWEEKKLSSVAKFSKGKGISKSDIAPEGILECIRYGELYTHYGQVINEVLSRTDCNSDQLVLSEQNDVIIPASGESQVDIATASCVLKSGIALGGDLNIIKTIHDGVFLAYYLSSKKRRDIANLAQGNSVVHLYSKQLASLSLNFPEMQEQQKIGIILTLIESRIQTQNKIIEQMKSLIHAIYKITFLGKSEFSSIELKKICSISKGTQINSTELSEKGDYYVMNGGILPSGYYSKYNSQENTISISEGGNSCGHIKFNESKFWSGGHCYTLKNISPTIDKRYLYHFLKANEQKIKALRVGSGLPNIQKSSLERFNIEIPDIEIQRKVSLSLDSLSHRLELERSLATLYKQQKIYLLHNLYK